MLAFPNQVLFVRFGAVAKCTLPILLKHISVDPQHITIMDFEPNEAALKPWIEQSMTFIRNRVTPENPGTLLSQHVSAGDLLIDLAWNIDCCEMVQWCHDQGVPYVNTSVELWDPYGGAGRQAPDRANTLLEAHEPAAVDCQVERAGADGGATRIVPAIAPSPRSTSCAATTTGYNRASAS
jgi:homospermidine synthase